MIVRNARPELMQSLREKVVDNAERVHLCDTLRITAQPR